MREKILEVILEALEIEDNNVKLSSDFRELAEWDSLSQLALVATLDEEFEVVIEMAEFDKLHTFAELISAIEKSTS